jgi:hypothetical protein
MNGFSSRAVRMLLGLAALLAAGSALADGNTIGAPGLGASSSWTIYAFGNAQAVADTLRALANFCASGTFQSVVGMVAVLGVLGVGMSGGFNPAMAKRFIGYAVTVFLTCYVLFGVSNDGPLVVNVEVIDTVDATWKAPVTVPAVVGIPAAMISTAGYRITQAIETSFAIPDALKMSNGAPFNLAAAMLADASKARITDPNLGASLAYYVQDCFTVGVAQGVLNAKSLLESKQFLTDIKFPSKTVMVNTLLKAGSVGTANIVNCTDGHKLLEDTIGKQGTDSASFLTSATAWARTPALNVVNAAADTTAQWASNNGITDGAALIKQSAVIGAFTGAYKQASAQTGNSEFLTGIALTQAMESQHTSWIVGAEIFNKTMGYIFAVLQVFVYGITPLILCASLIPGLGGALIKNFAQILLWLAIWQPMLAIVNFIILSMQQADLGGALASGGGGSAFTLANVGIISEKTANLRAAATFVGTMVPALAWAMVKGSVDFSRIIGSAVGENFAAGAANTMTTGNYSLNQASMDSFTSNKHSTAASNAIGNGFSTASATGTKTNEQGGSVAKTIGNEAVKAAASSSLSTSTVNSQGETGTDVLAGTSGTTAAAQVGTTHAGAQTTGYVHGQSSGTVNSAAVQVTPLAVGVDLNKQPRNTGNTGLPDPHTGQTTANFAQSPAAGAADGAAGAADGAAAAGAAGAAGAAAAGAAAAGATTTAAPAAPGDKKTPPGRVKPGASGEPSRVTAKSSGSIVLTGSGNNQETDTTNKGFTDTTTGSSGKTAATTLGSTNTASKAKSAAEQRSANAAQQVSVSGPASVADKVDVYEASQPNRAVMGLGFAPAHAPATTTLGKMVEKHQTPGGIESDFNKEKAGAGEAKDKIDNRTDALRANADKKAKEFRAAGHSLIAANHSGLEAGKPLAEAPAIARAVDAAGKGGKLLVDTLTSQGADLGIGAMEMAKGAKDKAIGMAKAGVGAAGEAAGRAADSTRAVVGMVRDHYKGDDKGSPTNGANPPAAKPSGAPASKPPVAQHEGETPTAAARHLAQAPAGGPQGAQQPGGAHPQGVNPPANSQPAQQMLAQQVPAGNQPGAQGAQQPGANPNGVNPPAGSQPAQQMLAQQGPAGNQPGAQGAQQPGANPNGVNPPAGSQPAQQMLAQQAPAGNQPGGNDQRDREMMQQLDREMQARQLAAAPQPAPATQAALPQPPAPPAPEAPQLAALAPPPAMPNPMGDQGASSAPNPFSGAQESTSSTQLQGQVQIAEQRAERLNNQRQAVDGMLASAEGRKPSELQELITQARDFTRNA